METSFFPLSLSFWSLEPVVIIALIVVSGAYASGFNYFKKQETYDDLVKQGLIKRSQPIYFSVALFTIFIALASPIDTLSDQLFTMHMIQHLLLALVAAPLLLMGIPEAFINPIFDLHPLIRPALRYISTGRAAFILFNLALVAWHIPPLYELTLQSEPIHNLEHAMFFWTGVLSWWPILSPTSKVPRLSYPGQLLYIFLVATPGALLGAWLVFTSRVLYPSYAAAPNIWNMSTLEDQQLGGLIMMVPGKFVYFIALTIVFFVWFNGQEESPYSTPTTSSS
ncbi:MAG: cytochrome c oxidase assembly protein [Chloroflexota bacterium]